MGELYVIIYKDNGELEGVTNNPDKWIMNHNSNRWEDGEEPEEKDEFNFILTVPKIY